MRLLERQMRSMTGFGRGSATLSGARVVVEARSVNNRFLDVRVRVPAELADHAFYVEQLARQRLGRGRYDITVRIEGGAVASPRIDRERARSVYRDLQALRDELAPHTELPITVLAMLPDALAAGSGLNPAAARQALEAALSEALQARSEMSSLEGSSLRQELEARLGAVREMQARIAGCVPEVVASYRNRLRQRIDRLLEETGTAADPDRLELEVALLADKSDVAEELARLSSHFDQLHALLGSEGPVGRRLDFLLQEISREANTIGAKCMGAAVSHLVVELKAEIERMREQVQNVE